MPAYVHILGQDFDLDSETFLGVKQYDSFFVQDNDIETETFEILGQGTPLLDADGETEKVCIRVTRHLTFSDSDIEHESLLPLLHWAHYVSGSTSLRGSFTPEPTTKSFVRSEEDIEVEVLKIKKNGVLVTAERCP